MKVTESQLRRMINEMMLDMEDPTKVEPEEDAWAGGDDNLVNPVDHTKVYKLIEASVRRSLRTLTEGFAGVTVNSCQVLKRRLYTQEDVDMYRVKVDGKVDGEDFTMVALYQLYNDAYGFYEVESLVLGGETLISEPRGSEQIGHYVVKDVEMVENIVDKITGDQGFENKAQSCLDKITIEDKADEDRFTESEYQDALLAREESRFQPSAEQEERVRSRWGPYR